LKKQYLDQKSKQNLTSFADHLDKQYEKRGTPKKDAYEQRFEVFKPGVLIQEIREQQNLTQEQLALKCRTTQCRGMRKL
jgi:HTH-type transcriptional regulator/antitoxin HipB